MWRYQGSVTVIVTTLDCAMLLLCCSANMVRSDHVRISPWGDLSKLETMPAR